LLGRLGGAWTGARGSVRAGLRAVVSPAGLRGALVEALWVGAHVATYPLGLVRDGLREELRLGLDGMDPVQRGLLIGDVEAAGTPILLVHGIIDNHSVFTVLRRGLRRRGFGRVTGVNYGWVGEDVRSLAARLAQQVEALCDESGYERIHIVGHSLGGLVARYYVQRLGGDARVHTLVTMGTPHQGSFWAHGVPHRLVRQLRPGSDLITELAAPAPGCRTRFLCFWSDLDQVVVPQRNARLVHPDLRVRSVLVRGVGHLSLPIHGGVVHQISVTLAHLDAHGDTVAPGVTSITPDDEWLGAVSPGAERGNARSRAGNDRAPTGSPAPARATTRAVRRTREF
jgi:hypothetical protein